MSVVYYNETCDRRDFVAKTLMIYREQWENARRIFVKPNVVSSEPYPTTTHPDVLDSLLSLFSDREVVVGDGPAVDAGRSDRIMQKTPLKVVCDKHHVSLVNLYSGPMRSVRSERGYATRVSSIPLSCDFVVSVPVLKVHNMCGVSGALKNQFGYLSKLDRILMHAKMKSLHKGIAEVNVAIPTDLFIVDAAQTMIGAQECRHGGCPAELGVMIAGSDPVSLDCYGFDLLEKAELVPRTRRSDVKYIDFASDYGAGSTHYELRKI